MKINLIKGETSVYSQVAKIKRINRLVLEITSLFFLVLLLIVGGQYGYYSIVGQEQLEKISSLENKYKSKTEEVVNYVRLKQVLVSAEEVIESRMKYQEWLSGAYATFPPGVEITNADFNEDKSLKFLGMAIGINEYSSFLKRFDEQAGVSGFLFEKVVQESLNRGSNGNYSFALKMISK